jgi:hypothetical protein
MTVDVGSVDELLRAIEQRADAGQSLDQIEAQVVRDAPLDEDRRSALWLYAWSRLEAPSRPHEQRPAVIGG